MIVNQHKGKVSLGKAIECMFIINTFMMKWPDFYTFDPYFNIHDQKDSIFNLHTMVSRRPSSGYQ
jgi:hypothetical protein